MVLPIRLPARLPAHPPVRLGLAAVLAAALSACGGGDAADPTPTEAVAEPAFHRMPLALPEPDDIDADGQGASAQRAPLRYELPAALRALDTRGLTDATVQAWQSAPHRATALATAPAPVVYTPAQIRAAYGLPTLAGADGPALGAGQTVFVIAAFHHPKAAADLAAFNTRFGLPGCTVVTVAPGSTRLPAPAAGCTFSVLFAGANATVIAKAPAYNAGWASEMALDTQWSHAIAPRARIVLIEAADASTTALRNAVALANRLGPGVVSMSFGAPEGSWVTSTASTFTGAGMSYLAATGDSGAAVSWPAVMPAVLAVGGTRLGYAGNGSPRTETAWASTGGGLSTVVAMPNYQKALTIPGEPTAPNATLRRAVADVAFNADPSTGQYVAFSAPTAKAPAWYAFGGTSLSTPQWAGLLAVANAQRAAQALGPLGDTHALLYGALGPGGDSYRSNFLDVVSGKNGGCPACTARSGYDVPTGLGTPRADALLPVLAAY